MFIATGCSQPDILEAYLTVRVSPGKHVLMWADGRNTKQSGHVGLDTASGGAYYVQVSLSGKVAMALVSKEIGESEIREKCTPISPVKLERR